MEHNTHISSFSYKRDAPGRNTQMFWYLRKLDEIQFDGAAQMRSPDRERIMLLLPT